MYLYINFSAFHFTFSGVIITSKLILHKSFSTSALSLNKKFQKRLFLSDTKKEQVQPILAQTGSIAEVSEGDPKKYYKIGENISHSLEWIL